MTHAMAAKMALAGFQDAQKLTFPGFVSWRKHEFFTVPDLFFFSNWQLTVELEPRKPQAPRVKSYRYTKPGDLRASAWEKDDGGLTSCRNKAIADILACHSPSA